MTTYKEIKGATVQTKDTDPELNVGTWAAGGDLNNGGQGRSAGGTQTSNIVFGGPSSPHAYVEEYNGTSWTETTEINTGRVYGFGCGTNAESAMASGGYTNPSGPWFTQTETWNGSSWTEVNEMITARGDGGMIGVVPGSIAAGGYSGSINPAVESWNGSSWSETTELNTARYYGCGIGTTGTAGLIVGGSTPSVTDANESWNGSAWTELNEINTARNRAGGSGTSTLGLAFGGAPHPKANTESWDGTSWTEVNDLATARYGAAGSPSGTSQLALASGGFSTTNLVNTEEFSFPPPTVAVLTEGSVFLSGGTTLKGFGKAAGIPAATWGSSASINTARGDGLGGFGTTSLAGVVGGDTGVPGDSWVSNTEIYNGSSWSEESELNTAGYFMQGTAGTSTSSITAGRRTSGNTDNVEKWNGSAWTEIAEINTARRGPQSAQPASSVSAFIIFGGYTTTQLANTETWDGTSWSETTDLNTVRYGFGGGGAGPSDAIACGGQGPPSGNATEIWNGSSWTEVAEMNASKIEGASAGVSTLLIYGGGNNPGGTGLETCEVYNGSSWSEVNDLADGENGSSCHIGTATDCFFVGGIGPTTPNAASASTEHFLADNALGDITLS